MAFGKIWTETERLSVSDRIELAHGLVQSVEEEPDPEHERLWMEEIERRCREIEEGTAVLIPADQALAEIRAKLEAMQSTREIQEDIQIVRSFEEIKGDAFELPADERLDLACAILRDLEDEGYTVDWDKTEVVGMSSVSHHHE